MGAGEWPLTHVVSWTCCGVSDIGGMKPNVHVRKNLIGKKNIVRGMENFQDHPLVRKQYEGYEKLYNGQICMV
jgi:hypothetical protein